MAEKVNFYQWLDLSVEHFEGDVTKLNDLLDKHIMDWNSSKSIKMQNRAAIYENDMRTAIGDPVKWKQIYTDYKNDVDADIIESIEYVADGKNVSSNDARQIAENQKVSENYVAQVAKTKGYTVGGGASGGTSPKPANKFALKDITPAPAVKTTLDGIQTKIEELNYADLSELINDQVDSGNISLESSSKEDVLKCLDEIKKRWERKSSNDATVSQKKSNFTNICVGIKNFLKKNELQDYVFYLQWRKVNTLLNSILSDLNKINRKELQDKPFNTKVDDIYGFIGKNHNREEAKSILESYCEEKGIAYPKPLPKIAACPFCNNNFEKSEPIQSKCPSCGKSFLVKCPKCGKSRNMITEAVCDGIDLQRYPSLLGKLEKAEGHYERLSLNQAKTFLAEIESEWPGFPGSAELGKKCQDVENQYGNDFRMIDRLCDEKKLHKAKEYCDKLIHVFPAARTKYDIVYQSLEEVKTLLPAFRSESDQTKKKILLRQMLSIVTDDPIVNMELPTVEAVTDLKVKENPDSGAIIISWASKNEPNSVDYHVIRKRLSAVANPDDGEELTQTQNLSFSDASAAEGEPYYYAVYASMGPINSPLATISKPTVILKNITLNVSAKDKAVDVTWPAANETIRAFYSESKITSFGQGTEVPNVTQSGFLLENLTNDKTYFFACYKTITYDGMEFRSTGSFATATPVEDVVAPVIAKSMGTEAGEYILTHENPQPGQTFQLYYSSSASVAVPTNQNVDLGTLQSKLKRLDCKILGNDRYSIQLKDQTEMIVYPVLCRGKVATVGNKLSLKYIKPVQITDHVITGNRLCLKLEAWPDGADMLYLCYNFDSFPEDKNDAERRIQISKSEFESTKMLEIQDLTSSKYYIALFARRLGEYIPVCNDLFDNSRKTRIEYSFSVGFMGKLTITLYNESPIRPALYFQVENGGVPLVLNKTGAVETIAANPSAPGVEKIVIPKFKVLSDMYGKLFSEDKSVELIVKGPSKLK